MVVYLDFLWLLNWAMNWWLLWATAKALRRRISPLGLMLVAGSGALVPMLWLVVAAPGWVQTILKLLVALTMVHLCFFPKGIRQSLHVTGLFLLMSALCAGVTLGLALLGADGSGEAFPAVGWYVVLGGPVIMTLPLQRLWSSLGRQFRQVEQSAKFRFVIHGVMVELFGLLDTGNILVEPITYRPVVVVDARSIKEYLPAGLFAVVEQWDALSEKSLHNLPDAIMARLTLIPFAAVAGGGLMVGIRPESCSILVKGSWCPVEAVVGFSRGEYARGEKFALLPAAVWPAA